MVCIIQAQHAACLLQLVIRESLERRLCRNRHKDRKRDGAMREMEGARARFGCLCLGPISSKLRYTKKKEKERKKRK